MKPTTIQTPDGITHQLVVRHSTIKIEGRFYSAANESSFGRPDIQWVCIRCSMETQDCNGIASQLCGFDKERGFSAFWQQIDPLYADLLKATEDTT